MIQKNIKGQQMAEANGGVPGRLSVGLMLTSDTVHTATTYVQSPVKNNVWIGFYGISLNQPFFKNITHTHIHTLSKNISDTLLLKVILNIDCIHIHAL